MARCGDVDISEHPEISFVRHLSPSRCISDDLERGV